MDVQFQTQAKNTEKMLKSLSFDERLRDAGILFLTSFRYEMIRLVLFLLLIGNYMILPLINGQGFNVQSISILLLASL